MRGNCLAECPGGIFKGKLTGRGMFGEIVGVGSDKYSRVN